ncbi:MAG: NADH-quinone oxidoreductase subunit A [Bordetella sp.]|nr:MAG: NADH-quinone oxidoreductase subunit A [Bordetella sp.]
MNLEEYFPIFLSIIIASLIGIFLLLIGYLISPRQKFSKKYLPYECGFDAFGDARMQVDIRYYLVAVLFILFDLEIAFLFPWAIAQESIGLNGFFAITVFLAILAIGFIYEWKKGALDWK